MCEIKKKKIFEKKKSCALHQFQEMETTFGRTFPTDNKPIEYKIDSNKRNETSYNLKFNIPIRAPINQWNVLNDRNDRMNIFAKHNKPSDGWCCLALGDGCVEMQAVCGPSSIAPVVCIDLIDENKP